MATRHNSCLNPALANDNTGWGGGSTPARAAVSGFGRPFAARYTAGTFSNSARGAVTASQPATLSLYAWLDTAGTAGGVLYVEWRDASQSVITYNSTNFSTPGQAVGRLSLTHTAPANAAFASMIVEYAFAGGSSDLTMLLIEDGAVLLDYFDGDSLNASWDGVPGNSASTLQDALTAILNATLPALDTDVQADVTVEATLAAGLPAFTAAATAEVEVLGQLAADLPPLAAALTGVVGVEATLAATLPALAATLTAEVTDPPQAVLAAVLPAVRVSLIGTSDATPPVIPDVTVRTPTLRQSAAGLPRLGSVLVGPPRLGGGD